VQFLAIPSQFQAQKQVSFLNC